MPGFIAPNVAPSGFERGLDVGTTIGGRIINTFDTHKKAEQDRALGEQQIDINAQIQQENDLKLADMKRQEILKKQEYERLSAPATDIITNMQKSNDPRIQGTIAYVSNPQVATKLGLPLKEDGTIDISRVTMGDLQKVYKALEADPGNVAIAIQPFADKVNASHDNAAQQVQDLQKQLKDINDNKKLTDAEKADKVAKIQSNLEKWTKELNDLKTRRDATTQALNLMSATHKMKSDYETLAQSPAYEAMDNTEKQIVQQHYLAGEPVATAIKTIDALRLEKTKEVGALSKAREGFAKDIIVAKIRNAGKAEKETDYNKKYQAAKRQAEETIYFPTEEQIQNNMLRGKKDAPKNEERPKFAKNTIDGKNTIPLNVFLAPYGAKIRDVKYNNNTNKWIFPSKKSPTGYFEVPLADEPEEIE